MPSSSLRTVQFQTRTRFVILEHSNAACLVMMGMLTLLPSPHYAYRRQMEARCGGTTVSGGTNRDIYN